MKIILKNPKHFIRLLIALNFNDLYVLSEDYKKDKNLIVHAKFEFD